MELEERLRTLASRLPTLRASAVEDVVRRGVARFAAEPDDAGIQQWLTETLPTEAPHCFASAAPSPPPSAEEIERQRILARNPTERLTLARAGTQPAPKQRRGPVSEAEAAAFAGKTVEEFRQLSVNERLTKARKSREGGA